MRKLVGLFAGAAILVAACGGTSNTPAPSTEAPSTGAESPADSASPSEPAAAGPIDLFGTDYAPAEGTAGGTVIIGDWQEATQFNPYYLGQVTEANVAAHTWHTPAAVQPRLQVQPAARGRADPDHRERWRHGR